MGRLAEYFLIILKVNSSQPRCLKVSAEMIWIFFGSAPCLSCTIDDFSDESHESLFSRVRDHVGGCSLGLTFCVFHLSLDSLRFGEDVNWPSALDVLLTCFYWSCSFPNFGDHLDSLSVRQFPPASSPVGSGYLSGTQDIL